MSKQSYAEKLRDPRWQRKRLEIMQRDGFACQDCESSENSLSVHHRYYISGRNPWEYPGFALRTLCEECHKIAHSEGRSEDGAVLLEEWESILNWLTEGGRYPRECSSMWYPMADLSEFLRMRDGRQDRERVWKRLNEMISEEFGGKNE